MNNKLAVMLCLAVLVTACAPAPDFSGVTPEQLVTPPPQPSPPNPESTVSSAIGVQPSTGDGIQPTGKTRYYTMTITKSGYAPKILTVTPGDRAKVTLTNADSKQHAFIVKELQIDYAVDAGETITMTFTPLVKGEFSWTERDGSTAGTLIVGGET